MNRYCSSAEVLHRVHVKKAVASRQLQFGAQTVLIEDVGIPDQIVVKLSILWSSANLGKTID